MPVASPSMKRAGVQTQGGVAAQGEPRASLFLIVITICYTIVVSQHANITPSSKDRIPR